MGIVPGAPLEQPSADFWSCVGKEATSSSSSSSRGAKEHSKRKKSQEAQQKPLAAPVGSPMATSAGRRKDVLRPTASLKSRASPELLASPLVAVTKKAVLLPRPSIVARLANERYNKDSPPEAAEVKAECDGEAASVKSQKQQQRDAAKRMADSFREGFTPASDESHDSAPCIFASISSSSRAPPPPLQAAAGTEEEEEAEDGATGRAGSERLLSDFLSSVRRGGLTKTAKGTSALEGTSQAAAGVKKAYAGGA